MGPPTLGQAAHHPTPTATTYTTTPHYPTTPTLPAAYTYHCPRRAPLPPPATAARHTLPPPCGPYDHSPVPDPPVWAAHCGWIYTQTRRLNSPFLGWTADYLLRYLPVP